MALLFQNLRFATRVLSKNAGFTGVVVPTLANGIGSAIFSLIQGVLMTPHPYANPQQLALIAAARLDGQRCSPELMKMLWLGYPQEAKSLEATAGFGWTFDFLIQQSGSENLEGMVVTPEYSRVLGLQPLLGRTFDADAAAQPSTVFAGTFQIQERR